VVVYLNSQLTYLAQIEVKASLSFCLQQELCVGLYLVNSEQGYEKKFMMISSMFSSG
jgi:hypothetical protein